MILPVLPLFPICFPPPPPYLHHVMVHPSYAPPPPLAVPLPFYAPEGACLYAVCYFTSHMTFCFFPVVALSFFFQTLWVSSAGRVAVWYPSPLSCLAKNPSSFDLPALSPLTSSGPGRCALLIFAFFFSVFSFRNPFEFFPEFSKTTPLRRGGSYGDSLVTCPLFSPPPFFRRQNLLFFFCGFSVPPNVPRAQCLYCLWFFFFAYTGSLFWFTPLVALLFVPSFFNGALVRVSHREENFLVSRIFFLISLSSFLTPNGSCLFFLDSSPVPPLL